MEGILPRERIVEEYGNDEELKAYKKAVLNGKLAKAKANRYQIVEDQAKMRILK